MSCGNYNYGVSPKGTFRIIQGDTFQKTLVVRLTGGDKLDGTVISKIYFTCDKLGIHNKEVEPKKDLEGNEIKGNYKLTFTDTDTKKFPKCNTTYDITILFGKGGSADVVKTVRYQYPLEVLPKTNYINYDEI